MKKIFQTLCLLLAATMAAACDNTESTTPLGPIGEAPAEDDPNAEHIYLWPEGNMPTETNYTVNNGNYQDDPDFRPNMPAERLCSVVETKAHLWRSVWRNWAGKALW